MRHIWAAFLIVAAANLTACGHIPRDACNTGLQAIDNFENKDGISKLTFAAWAGNAGAQNLLGRMYFDGSYVYDDLEKSLFWTEKAAKNGHPHAQVRLGILYSMSLKTNLNFLKTEKWFRRAAEQGDVHGSYNSALLLVRKYKDATSKELKGELKNAPQKALKYMRYAAENGLPEAKYNMALYYQDGFGVETKNPEIAVSWLRKIQLTDYFEPAYFSLAWAYKRGWGVEKDIEKSNAYLKKLRWGISSLKYKIVDKNNHMHLWSALNSNDFNNSYLKASAVEPAFASTYLSADPRTYDSAFVAAADTLGTASRILSNYRVERVRRENYPACMD